MGASNRLRKVRAGMQAPCGRALLVCTTKPNLKSRVEDVASNTKQFEGLAFPLKNG